MPSPSPFRKYTTAFIAITALGSSAASAAPVPAPRLVDPLVVVSVFGTADSRAAICAAGASAAAAAGTAAAAGQAPGTAGCVLPVVDTPPPPVAETAAPEAFAPIAPSTLYPGATLLLGIAAIVGIAAILLGNANENGEIDLPISP